jgi:vacuolar protein sorting-associated protein VTA1
MWAVMLAMKETTRSPELSAAMLEIMDRLETSKAQVGLQGEEADRGDMEAFALQVFDNADRVDRAGRASAATANTFYAAGIFLDVLRQFYPEESLPEELEKKQC